MFCGKKTQHIIMLTGHHGDNIAYDAVLKCSFKLCTFFYPEKHVYDFIFITCRKIYILSLSAIINCIGWWELK